MFWPTLVCKNNLKLKKVTETDTVSEKWTFLTNTSFFNNDKVKFLQIKQGTLRQKCYQKHEKRLREKVQLRTSTWRLKPPPTVRSCTHFGWIPHPPPVAYVLNWWFLSQIKTYKDIRISNSLKYKHSKK